MGHVQGATDRKVVGLRRDRGRAGGGVRRAWGTSGHGIHDPAKIPCRRLRRSGAEACAGRRRRRLVKGVRGRITADLTVICDLIRDKVLISVILILIQYKATDWKRSGSSAENIVTITIGDRRPARNGPPRRHGSVSKE